MPVPRQARYVVVGAGIHGLSTAYHLAQELRVARGRLGRRRPRPREVARRRRRLGHRVRRRAQQLLPAGDERAHAGLCRGVGVRSRRVPLQRRRLHRARRAGAGAGPRRDVRAPAADRLPLRADRGRGGGRRAHEGSLPGLARAGRDHLPPRAPGRIRVQPRVGRRAPGQVPRGGRLRPRGHRGHGFRVPATTAPSPPSRRTRAPSRSASRSWSRRGRGPRSCGRCSACRTRSTSRRRPATSSATGRCGRTGTSRRARSRSTR